jgi:glutathione synthase/RimK-type ligase-like ATP-grasp enzyme
MAILLVTDSLEPWLANIQGVEHIDAREYLTEPDQKSRRGHLRVYNLCKSYAYQSLGYYVSLLAEARGHRPFPSVMTIQDLHGTSAMRLIPHELEELIEHSLAPLTSEKFTLSVYFGRNTAKRYDRLSRELSLLFQAPLLRFSFSNRGKWRLRGVSALGTDEVPERHRDFVSEAAQAHFRRGLSQRSRRAARFDMAILYNPDEGDLAPSDKVALQRMIRAAASFDISAELITRCDADRLLEFDALFIRETTAINHHTYRFARRAEHEGLAVIDDPLSILRCTNKVYLAELLQKNKLPIPRTIVTHKGNADQIPDELGFPLVLKRPDSAFSLGVLKVNDVEQWRETLKHLFTQSELVIAQQFTQTDYDWRIGVLDGRGLYACKYHMAPGHWQIAKHDDGKSAQWGKCETIPVEVAPRKIVAAAIKAASLIGDGLYGVDVKEYAGNPLVIEVNDNPNLESGVEDAVLRDELYRRIAESFLRRIERRKY